MAHELVVGLAQTVSLAPRQRGLSASVDFRDSKGASLWSGAATLDTFNGVVASVGTSPDVLVLTAPPTGLSAGQELWLTAAEGWAAKVVVAKLSAGNTVTLESPPPGGVAAGDTLQGLVFTASIPSTALLKPELHCELRWTIASPAQVITEAAHVVRTPWRTPVAPEDAAALASAWHPAWARTQNHGTWRSLASKATFRVRQILTATEDYPHRVGDPEVFRIPGEIALRIELAYLGRVPQGYDAAAYLDDQVKMLERACREALGGTRVDRNDDGATGANEVRGARSINIVRV